MMLKRRFKLGLEFELLKNRCIDISLIRLGDVILNDFRKRSENVILDGSRIEKIIRLEKNYLITTEINNGISYLRRYEVREGYVHFDINSKVIKNSK